MPKTLHVTRATLLLAGGVGVAALAAAVLLTVLVHDRSADRRSTVVVATVIPATPADPAATSLLEAPAQPVLYSNPFDYCAGVGDAPGPDHRYRGEPDGGRIPELRIAFFRAIAKANDRPLPTDSSVATNSTIPWRCMNGYVWGCYWGANTPCSQANLNNEPTTRLQDWCRTSTEQPPASENSSASIYRWECRSGVAVNAGQYRTVDRAGYINGLWFALEMP